MNAVDIICLAVLAISVLYGMYRGFISGILSLAALVGSVFAAYLLCGRLAEVIRSNQVIVNTISYYMTDIANRIGSADLSMLPVSQVSPAALEEILQKISLPDAFNGIFRNEMLAAMAQGGTMRVSEVINQTIVSCSITILSFLICFLGCYLAALFVVHLISYVFEFPVLRHLDSLVGGLFGFVRGYCLLVVLFILVPLVLSAFPIEQVKQIYEASQLKGYFEVKFVLSVLNAAL